MTSKKLLERFAYPLLFVCLWSTGYIGARLGMPHADPGTFLAIRFALALLILSIACHILKARWPNRREAAHSVAIGLLVHGVYLGSVFWAIGRGLPAGVSAIIVGLQPLVTSILAGWLLKETLGRKHWVGILAGLFGVALVVGPKIQVSDTGITPITVSVTMLGMLSITLGTIYQKTQSAIKDLRTSTTLQYLGAFIPVFLLSALFEDRVFHVNLESVFALVWLVFVLSILAVFLLMWLIRQGSVSTVSSLFYLVPVVTSLIAYGLFGETLTGIQILGMGISTIAVAIVTRNSKPNAE